MNKTINVKTENYLKAFIQFSGCTIEDITSSFRLIDSEPCIKYNGQTYLVSTYNDFLKDYRHFIKTPSYDEIYARTPISLWEYFIYEIGVFSKFTSDKIIVSLYSHWCAYWSEEIQNGSQNKPHLEKLRDRSYQDFQVLMQTVAIEPDNILTNASLMQNEIIMIGIVVMTIYELYNMHKDEGSDNEFFYECLKFVIAHGQELISDGETFEKVTLVTKTGMIDFFIYNSLIEFQEASESLDDN